MQCPGEVLKEDIVIFTKYFGKHEHAGTGWICAMCRLKGLIKICIMVSTDVMHPSACRLKKQPHFIQFNN